MRKNTARLGSSGGMANTIRGLMQMTFAMIQGSQNNPIGGMQNRPNQRQRRKMERNNPTLRA